MAAIPNLVAINSVLSVDLMGEANAEMLDGRQVSGTGGLLDFVRGARLSRGGRSILALPSTAAGGKVSRIVAKLGERDIVSCPRADADIVVTEHGVGAAAGEVARGAGRGADRGCRAGVSGGAGERRTPGHRGSVLPAVITPGAPRSPAPGAQTLRATRAVPLALDARRGARGPSLGPWRCVWWHGRQRRRGRVGSVRSSPSMVDKEPWKCHP